MCVYVNVHAIYTPSKETQRLLLHTYILYLDHIGDDTPNLEN